MAEKTINIGGRLHSTATGNVVAAANEVFDYTKNKTQEEINADTYSKEETYNKNELNNLITTPDVQHITVPTFDNLPASGSANTIYRVSNWDGGATPPAVDASKYSEYGWDGSRYVLLSVKSAVDEVFDVSVFNAESGVAKAYETLTAALGGVPANRKKGGMSIKFIQTTPATYNVVKTEGVTELPAGTLLDSTSSIASGTYTASQLSDFATLPTTSAVTYYVAVTEDETTTYTTWVITLASAEIQEYVQYRLMKTAWSNVVGDWQGVDSELKPKSKNPIENGAVVKEIGALVLEGSAHVSISETTNIISQTNLGYTLEAGTVLRIEAEGISTTDTTQPVGAAYIYFNGSNERHTISKTRDYTLEEDVTRIRVAVAADRVREDGGHVSVKIFLKGLKQEVDIIKERLDGINNSLSEAAQNIEELQESEAENEANIHKNKLLSIGGNIGSYNGNPIPGGSQAIENNMVTIYNIPAGGKIVITSDGIGRAVTDLVYRVHGSIGTIFRVSPFELAVEDDIEQLDIYSTSGQIIDSSETITISVDYIGAKQELDKTNQDVQELQENDIIILGVDVFNYNGAPKTGNYINSSSLNYPAGKYRLTVDGIGTAISKWSYAINGTSYTGKSYSEIEYTLDALTSLRIWTSAAYIIDDTKTVKFKVHYIGLADKVDEIQNKIDNNGFIRDFYTNDIINRFATDAANKEFSNTFSFTINSDGHTYSNIMVSAYAKFVNNVDDAVPTIQFKYICGSTIIYTSTAYTIGKKDEYCQREWRVPAFRDDCSIQIIVTIPENVTLYIEEISNRYSDAVNRNNLGYRMNAHLSFYNFNSLNGFTEAAKLGYPCAVAVPKRTSDGVWVCFHDDSLSTQLIDANGNTPADNHPGEELTISSLTYAELQTYTYRANSFGEKLKVPTLEEFFMVCAKTGMHPMFSWHPVSSTEKMQEVKTMAIKFGLLPYLNIKMAFSGDSTSTTYMRRAYSVFGDAIESYTGDVNVDTSVSDIITALDSVNIDKTKVRVGLEFFNSKVTVEKVQDTLAAGYFAAIAWMTANPTGEQMEYWIKNGVTEFTEYNMVSYGLNW